MAYRIAVATSDEVNVDLSFQSALKFRIYEVGDNGSYTFLENRSLAECFSCAGDQGRCDGCYSGSKSPKVLLVQDCRCVVCSGLTLHEQKKLEKNSTDGFDIGCAIDKALKKIIEYYARTDHHISLRGLAHE